MIKPIPFELTDIDGEKHTYILSRFPATKGREILAKYPLTNLPKLGKYVESQENMLELMAFVAVQLEDGRQLPLTTQALVDNHVPDGESLIRLEIEMLKYNTSFFGLVGSSQTWEGLIQRFLPIVIETLATTLGQSSPPDLQPSTSSKPSTT